MNDRDVVSDRWSDSINEVSSKIPMEFVQSNISNGLD